MEILLGTPSSLPSWSTSFQPVHILTTSFTIYEYQRKMKSYTNLFEYYFLIGKFNFFS